MNDHDESNQELIIDSDWKEAAQAEKARLAKEEKESMAPTTSEESMSGKGVHALPEPSFKALVSLIASQALSGLGTMTDPASKGVIVDLEGSQFAIDLLQVLLDASVGNITKEESSELSTIMTELRARYVQITQMIAQQASAPVQGTPPSSPAP